MGFSIVIGEIAGIKIQIHWSWLLAVLLVVGSLGTGYFPFLYAHWSPVTIWSTAVGAAFLFFLSILAHELGHSLVAQRAGVPVESITLFILGGIARIAHEPPSPGDEFKIVAAGPLTSFLLAAVFALLSRTTQYYEPAAALTGYLMLVNLVLGLFNLLPGFPMDGGRILRSLLWKRMHSFRRSTRWAGNVGLVMAMSMLGAGLVTIWRGLFWSGAWIGFVGWYLGTIAEQNRDRRSPGANYVEETNLPRTARTGVDAQEREETQIVIHRSEEKEPY